MKAQPMDGVQPGPNTQLLLGRVQEALSPVLLEARARVEQQGELREADFEEFHQKMRPLLEIAFIKHMTWLADGEDIFRHVRLQISTCPGVGIVTALHAISPFGELLVHDLSEP